MAGSRTQIFEQDFGFFHARFDIPAR